MVLNTEGRFKLHMRKKFFIKRLVKHWHKVAQEGGRCPIPGNI